MFDIKKINKLIFIYSFIINKLIINLFIKYNFLISYKEKF